MEVIRSLGGHLLLVVLVVRGRHRPAVALPDGAVDVAVVADDAKVDVRYVHGLRGRHVLVDLRMRLVGG